MTRLLVISGRFLGDSNEGCSQRQRQKLATTYHASKNPILVVHQQKNDVGSFRRCSSQRHNQPAQKNYTNNRYVHFIKENHSFLVNAQCSHNTCYCAAMCETASTPTAYGSPVASISRERHLAVQPGTTQRVQGRNRSLIMLHAIVCYCY